MKPYTITAETRAVFHERRDKHMATEWVKRELENSPPARYDITVTQMIDFKDLYTETGDFFSALAAAYNYGFKRGRNCERNTSKAKNK